MASSITPIEIIQRHLNEHTGFEVVSKVPVNRPTVFLRVDMAAPQRINLLQYATLIIVQAYGPNPDVVLDALQLASHVLEQMDWRDPQVSGWDEDTGPVEHADPDIEMCRWQFTGTLYHTLD